MDPVAVSEFRGRAAIEVPASGRPWVTFVVAVLGFLGSLDATTARSSASPHSHSHKMVRSTMIFRVPDGLPLAASVDDNGVSAATALIHVVAHPPPV